MKWHRSTAAAEVGQLPGPGRACGAGWLSQLGATRKGAHFWLSLQAAGPPHQLPLCAQRLAHPVQQRRGNRLGEAQLHVNKATWQSGGHCSRRHCRERAFPVQQPTLMPKLLTFRFPPLHPIATQTTYLSFTCGPASGGTAGTADGAAAAAAASALLSAIPCSKVPGALHNPGLAEAAQQVAAFQQILACWGTKVRGQERFLLACGGLAWLGAGSHGAHSATASHDVPGRPKCAHPAHCAHHPARH